MKKISNEEYSQIIEGEKNQVIRFLNNLDINEGAYIIEGEWKLKTPINVYVSNYYKNSGNGMNFKVTKIRNGYVIKRLN